MSPTGLPEEYLSQSQNLPSPDSNRLRRLFSSDSTANSTDQESSGRMFSPDIVQDHTQHEADLLVDLSAVTLTKVRDKSK